MTREKLLLEKASQVSAPIETGMTAAGASQSTGTFTKNAVVMDPPFCKLAPAKKAVAGLPVFVFVAGVEGSGHHALKDVWHSLSAAGVGVYPHASFICRNTCGTRSSVQS